MSFTHLHSFLLLGSTLTDDMNSTHLVLTLVDTLVGTVFPEIQDK